jgi:hypothetical protein
MPHGITIERHGNRRVLRPGELLRDGERLRVPLMLRDGFTPVQRAIASEHNNQRFAAAMDAALHRPGFRIPVKSLDGTTRIETLVAGNHMPVATIQRRKKEETEDADPRAQAYADYDAATADAWKHPASFTDAKSGIYPLSAGEGSACDLNGERGTLVREGDHLVCRVTQAPRGGDRAAVEDAYRAYDEQAQNAWRKR